MQPWSKHEKNAQPARSNTAWHRVAYFAGGLLVLWALLAWQPMGNAGEAAATTAGTSSEMSEGYDLFGFGNILAILILGGGVGLAIYMHKSGNTSSPKNNYLQTIGRLRMPAGQELTLVRCQDDVLLLGMTGEHVTLLKTYPDGTFREETMLDDAPQTPSFDFADVLRSQAARFSS